MQPVDRPSAEAEMRRLDATQFPLTPFQQYLANHSQGKSIAHPRHLRTIELTRQLTVEQVNHALHQLTTRHAALCCRFNRLRDGQWTQRFDHPSPGPLALVDSLNCASTDLDMRLASVVCQLDIRRGPVIRAALVTLVDAPQLTLLVLAAPYLVVDDPSWDILFQDLSDILDNRSLSPIQLRYPLWLTEFQAQGLRRSLKHDPIQPIAALPKLSQRLVGCDYTANVQRQTIQLPEPLVAILDQVMSTPSRWGVTCTDLVTIALLQILSEDANDISTTLCTAQSWLQRFQHVKQALRVAQRNSCSYQQDALDFDPLLPKSTGKVLLRLRHQPQECPLGQQRFDLTPMVTSDQWTNRVWDLVWTINNVAILQELGIEVTSTRLPSAELNRVAKRFEMRLQEVARDFSQALDAMPALWVPAEFPHVALTFDKLSWLEQELLASNLTANQVQTVYPLLSNLQAMLWATVSQASHYVNQFVVTIHGLSHPTQLHQAISQVVSRHEALRSRFFFTRSGPLLEGVQVVLDPLVSVKWAWAMDWPSLGATDENTYLRLPQAQGFEDVHGAMFQCTAVGAPADGIRLVMTVHHALVDGWSFGLLLQELVHTLNGGLDQPSLSRPVSLGGYMAFQAAYDHQADRDFWHNYLEGITSCTALCSPPSSSAVVRYGLHKRTLPLDLGALQMAVQSHGLTVHCVLAVAWALVLQMHTGRHDVVFGNTVSGRSVGVPRIDEMIGCLIVDVPLRVQLVPTRTLGELLETMRQDLVDTTAHAACPLSQAQTWMDGPLDAYCLYNTLLVYENDLTGVPTAGYHAVYLDDLSVHGGDDCDCTLTFTMVGAAFGVVMSCNRTKISAEYGQLLLDHLQHCLLLLRDHLVSNCLETLVNNLPLPKNE
ncbi:hypothetical protein H4R34_004762 [Dimargaris verticillata]|uniref:Condensation domain-containing protein n=1 Tax=Dimargaris verticillata TaxID=2761393 RepID=A0A9W8B018_9FUNG|nr:hypothetical protein H4R34_004762 [Dimargaris verticillata]